MKITKAATSVIEAMVIMLIIVTGVVGMYNIYIESVRLSDTTAQRLQAIQIAREGLEAVENIRNTNWILYAADYKNCWNTHDYRNDCIGNSAAGSDIGSGSYIIYQNSNFRWQLANVDPVPTSFNAGYISEFEVYRDVNGFYTQSGSTDSLQPTFTREIQISYPTIDQETDMQVSSIVQWSSRGNIPHNIQLDLTLTNWKDKD